VCRELINVENRCSVDSNFTVTNNRINNTGHDNTLVNSVKFPRKFLMTSALYSGGPSFESGPYTGYPVVYRGFILSPYTNAWDTN
jgi:hypothetical protein